MLIVLDKPSPDGELAVNTDAYDKFIIRVLDDGKFQLCCQKSFDAYFSNKSAILFRIETFDTSEKCIDLFREIVKAKKAGETVYDLSEYLKKQEPVSDALLTEDMPSA